MQMNFDASLWSTAALRIAEAQKAVVRAGADGRAAERKNRMAQSLQGVDTLRTAALTRRDEIGQCQKGEKKAPAT